MSTFYCPRHRQKYKKSGTKIIFVLPLLGLIGACIEVDSKHGVMGSINTRPVFETHFQKTELLLIEQDVVVANIWMVEFFFKL